jgi:hypoxanthine-guanine phosphoribosyltransferase
VKGFVIYFFGCLISWKSRSQKLVILLLKAGYYLISKLCAEIMFLKIFIEFLKIKSCSSYHCQSGQCGSNLFGTKCSIRTKDNACRHQVLFCF